MVDRGKVIKGLEHHSRCQCSFGRDDMCPYWIEENDSAQLCRDALALLKAQEPRVMTLEEMREGEVYWFDYLRNFLLCPVIFNMYDQGDSSYLNFVWQYGNSSWKICEYRRTWRCWTARPTQEQREATPWDE